VPSDLVERATTGVAKVRHELVRMIRKAGLRPMGEFSTHPDFRTNKRKGRGSGFCTEFSMGGEEPNGAVNKTGWRTGVSKRTDNRFRKKKPS